MSRLASRLILVAAFAALHSPAAVVAQQLLLHFPLDGSPQVLGTAAGPAKVYVASGGTPPRVVPGKFGQALHFDGTSSIALPFSLDAVAYPSMTVTAWVKLDPGSSGERTVFSAGNGNVPRLMIHGDRVNFVAARGSLMFGAGMPRDEWVFVAGVIEPARQMAIDDLRVYAGALSQEQVAALRSAATVESYAAIPAADGSTASASASKPAFYGGALTDENVADLSEAVGNERPRKRSWPGSRTNARRSSVRRKRRNRRAILRRCRICRWAIPASARWQAWRVQHRYLPCPVRIRR